MSAHSLLFGLTLALLVLQWARDAVAAGELGEPFSASDIDACLGITYASTFLPKHRVGNPGGHTELFVRVSRQPARYRLR